MYLRAVASADPGAFVNDAFFADDLHELPGNFFIKYREFSRFQQGQDYNVHDGNTGETITVPPVTEHEFNYYYSMWKNYHYFGLPHGGGWLNERGWVLDVIKLFEKIKQEIQNYNTKRQRRS